MSRFCFCNCPAGFSAEPERHAPDCPGRSGAGKARTPVPATLTASQPVESGVDFGIDGRSVRVSQEAYSIFLAREAAGREKVAALQQRLTAADERADLLNDLLLRTIAYYTESCFPEDLLLEVKAALKVVSLDRTGPTAVVPDGYCIMPRRLTAENGAKALLLGEFKLKATQECPECRELEEPMEGCEICDGEGEYGQQYTISWDQIKFIYSKAVSGLAMKAESAKSR